MKTSLQGAVMVVPAAHQADLDAREVMYARVPVSISGRDNAVTYEVQEHTPHATKPILRSYLDVVLSGYEAMFGGDALPAFYDTTAGWEVGILDDRAAPIYPRHQPISKAQSARYDALHSALTTVVK
jgi:hypothetical protein